jgi:hypothetical protein
MMKRTLLAAASLVMMGGLFALQARTAVFVRIAPPRPVIERVVPAPGPHYVWVGGYYRWSGRAYVWVPGRWAHPPRPRVVWVAPHWNYVPARHGYVFVGGYWR